jgi:hypothetical protein
LSKAGIGACGLLSQAGNALVQGLDFGACGRHGLAQSGDLKLHGSNLGCEAHLGGVCLGGGWLGHGLHDRAPGVRKRWGGVVQAHIGGGLLPHVAQAAHIGKGDGSTVHGPGQCCHHLAFAVGGLLIGHRPVSGGDSAHRHAHQGVLSLQGNGHDQTSSAANS